MSQAAAEFLRLLLKVRRNSALREQSVVGDGVTERVLLIASTTVEDTGILKSCFQNRIRS